MDAIRQKIDGIRGIRLIVEKRDMEGWPLTQDERHEIFVRSTREMHGAMRYLGGMGGTYSTFNQYCLPGLMELKEAGLANDKVQWLQCRGAKPADYHHFALTDAGKEFLEYLSEHRDRHANLERFTEA